MSRKNKSPILNWDAEKGIATYTIRDKDRIYEGKSFCHTDDKEHMSETIGMTIAEKRAVINCLKSHLQNELKPGLASLKQLYYSINNSKNYNPKAYESKMIKRHIQMKKDDIELVRKLIQNEKDDLRKYLKIRTGFDTDKKN